MTLDERHFAAIKSVLPANAIPADVGSSPVLQNKRSRSDLYYFTVPRGGVGRNVSTQFVGAIGHNMVNFGPMSTVPEKFKDRKFYIHNPNVTLMRTTVEENRKLGEEIGRKAAVATGPTSIMIPLKGVSAIDQTGKTFDDQTARQALNSSIRTNRGAAELVELDYHINDAAFAEAAAQKLLQLIQS